MNTDTDPSIKDNIPDINHTVILFQAVYIKNILKYGMPISVLTALGIAKAVEYLGEPEHIHNKECTHDVLDQNEEDNQGPEVFMIRIVINQILKILKKLIIVILSSLNKKVYNILIYIRTYNIISMYIIYYANNMEKLTVTNLRSNIYKIIDEVIETGIPKTIKRKGHKVKIVVDDETRSKFSNLEKHNSIICNPDSLISEKCCNWSEEDKL